MSTSKLIRVGANCMRHASSRFRGTRDLVRRAVSLGRRLSARVWFIVPVGLLAGCNTVLLKPSGAVAAQQGHLIVVSTFLMLLIVVPVIALTILFAWRYRQSNSEATYTPDWDHSTQLELVIWAAPLLIIIALGALTWISSHTLDPYRPLQRLDAQERLDASRAIAPDGLRGGATDASRAGAASASRTTLADAPRGDLAAVKPLTIEVVALDWKWLFIYPEQGVAVVNEVAAPINVPINFKITASSVMNSFFVPALAGQIYAMPGMQTQLNAIMNTEGDYDGFSANYSGAGFSGMRFKFRGLSTADFQHWVQSAQAAGGKLDSENYLQLEKPSQREPVRRYSSIDAGLYDQIVSQCVRPCPN